MALNNLKDLYVEQLRDLYSAENQILKALPQMAEKASHQELRSAFEEHRTVTERQVERLDRIFSDLSEKPKGHHCKGMEGLLKEGQELMQEKAADDVMDAGLIAAAQRVEHYEMAGYGTVRTYADMLGQQEHSRLLQQTLDEEGQTDERLTQLAERVINIDAIRDR
ncbi:ferritin-like domain-containing protein [soil metagenome]